MTYNITKPPRRTRLKALYEEDSYCWCTRPLLAAHTSDRRRECSLRRMLSAFCLHPAAAPRLHSVGISGGSPGQSHGHCDSRCWH